MTHPFTLYWCDWAELADLAQHLATRAAAKGVEDATAWAEIAALIAAVRDGAEIPPRTLHRRELHAAALAKLERARPETPAAGALAEITRQLAPWDEARPLASLSNIPLIERNHQLTLALRAQTATERKAA